jgi:uncharacterized protein YkwD
VQFVVRLAGVVFAVASLAAAACGGSSHDSGQQAALAPTPTATPTPAAGVVGEATAGRIGDGTIDDNGRQSVSPGHAMNPVDIAPLPTEGVGSAARCADQTIMLETAGPARYRAALYCLINAQRRDRGLRTLRKTPTLARGGTRHSQNMVAKRYFAHIGPDGPSLHSRLAAAGYKLIRPWSVGETLAWGTSTLSTPRAVVNAWLHSHGHRLILLGVRWRELGVGFAPGNPTDAGQGVTVAAEFGVRG